MPKNSEGRDQIASLQKAFTRAGLEQEFSQERYIKIPKEVRKLYMQMGRPSPLFRATKLEEYLNTPAKIYYKREDTSPTGSHKLNSAIPQAYFAKKEGVERLTTKTDAVWNNGDPLTAEDFKRGLMRLFEENGQWSKIQFIEGVEEYATMVDLKN